MRTLAICLLLVFTSPLFAADWPQWRGPNRDGHAESAIESWPKSLKQKWRVVVGEGHSSPIVVGKHVFIHARQKDREVVRCLNLADGKPVWEKSYAAPYEMHPAARAHGKGPKSTPLVADGRLYTFGISGVLTCYNAKSGKQIWQRRFDKTYKLTSPLYGTAMSPLLYEGLLIAHVGGHNKGALTAFDAKTGKTRWQWDKDGPGYTSPILFQVGKSQHLVTQSQQWLLGINPKTGKELWRLKFKTGYDQNSITPVAYKDLLIISGYRHGTQAYRIKPAGDGFETTQAWSAPRVSMYMSSPVLNGKYLFGMMQERGGQLFCMAADSGKTLWTSSPRYSKNAALIDVGSAILSQSVQGELQVLSPTFAKIQVKAKYRLSTSPMWAHPAIVGKLLLAKDNTALICFSVE